MDKLKTRRQALGGALKVAAAGVLLPQAFACGDNAQGAQPLPRPETPEGALEALRAGNVRFYTQQPHVRTVAELEQIWTKISVDQAPFASIVGCADSRLAPELIFDQSFGDIFVVREAGNIANSPTSLGSLEYAQAVLRSKLVLVLGHTRCGAVGAAFTKAQPGGNIQSIVDAIEQGIQGASTLDEAIVDNVKAVMDTIRRDSQILYQAERDGDIWIVGGIYDIASAVVTFLDV